MRATVVLDQLQRPHVVEKLDRRHRQGAGRACGAAHLHGRVVGIPCDVKIKSATPCTRDETERERCSSRRSGTWRSKASCLWPAARRRKSEGEDEGGAEAQAAQAEAQAAQAAAQAAAAAEVAMAAAEALLVFITTERRT